jgi:SAM-dependent methyltransferase
MTGPRALRPIIRWAGELQTWWWLRTHHTPDRHVLEHVVLPALAERTDVNKLLFVGCARYTRRYPDLFVGREFWTLDVDPDMRRYGAQLHVVGSLGDLHRHFRPAELDAIVCNGILGWGLDEQDDAEAAIAHCYACLRPGGLLVLGWEEWVPVPPDSIDALEQFERVTLAPFPAPRYPTFSYTNHTFDFYARPT